MSIYSKEKECFKMELKDIKLATKSFQQELKKHSNAS